MSCLVRKARFDGDNPGMLDKLIHWHLNVMINGEQLAVLRKSFTLSNLLGRKVHS